MLVSNGTIQTIIQGHSDETDMPPELITGTTNDNEASTLVATPLLVTNASLSEDGGDTDDRSNDELRGGSGQALGGGAVIDKHPHVSPTHSLLLSMVHPRPQQ